MSLGESGHVFEDPLVSDLCLDSHGPVKYCMVLLSVHSEKFSPSRVLVSPVL